MKKKLIGYCIIIGLLFFPLLSGAWQGDLTTLNNKQINTKGGNMDDGTQTIANADNDSLTITAVQMATSLDSIEAVTDRMEVQLDSVVSNTSSIQTEVETIDVSLDSIEAVTDRMEVQLDSIESNTSSIQTSVETLDNAVDGNYINANNNIAGTDVAANSGNNSAQTQRVTVANDDSLTKTLVRIDVNIDSMEASTDSLEAIARRIEASADEIEAAVEIIDDWDDSNLANVNLNIAGTDVSANAGDNSAQTQRVTIAHNDSLTKATVRAMTALEIMDDWDDSDLANVNLNIAGTDVAANAGNNDAYTQRVTIARDDSLIKAAIRIITAVEVIDDWDDSNLANVNINVAGTDVAAGSGDLSAQTPRISVANNDSLIKTIVRMDTSLDSIESNTGSIQAEVETIDVSCDSIEANTQAIETAVEALTTLAGATEVTPTQITKTVAAIATPEAIAADGTYFRTATLIGKKAARTNNAGTVYIGIGATNDTQAYPVQPGESITLTMPAGEKGDLNDWYIDAENAGDGLVVIY